MKIYQILISDFENPDTRHVHIDDYKSRLIFDSSVLEYFSFSTLLDEDYLNIKPGAIHGQENGIELLVDVETFEYGLFPKSARGFILALSDAGERPMIRQEGK